MLKKEKIGIVGLGLIGGSIALALKDKYDILGYDIDGDTTEYAKNNGYCFVAPPPAMTECKVIFVCVSLSSMGETLAALSELLPNNIISDVASVKVPFEKTSGLYVGGHPMAGTEYGGIRAAKGHLFQNAYWVLTSTSENAKIVARVVKDMGALSLFMTAEEHDEAVSVYSHAPHAMAYALSNIALRTLPIAGSGFLDTTRVAKSDGSFWADCFLMNDKNVLEAIDGVQYELDQICEMIKRGDREKLAAYLNGARQNRLSLEKIALGGEALYVDLVDRTGEFESVLSLLSSNGIDVRNIGLVPNREGDGGALRLEFSSGADRDKAINVLGKERVWLK